MIQELGHSKNKKKSYQPGEKIHTEGDESRNLHLILEGEVEMLKQGKKGEQVRVDTFTTGDLIGLTSFWTYKPSFLEARALSPVTCYILSAEEIEHLAFEKPEVRETLHQLFISNLSDRYRRMVTLNLQVRELSDALKKEQGELKQALHDLEQTRNQLIHSEKLATLGQLLAGITHEINNPCATLNGSVESLTNLFYESISHYNEHAAQLLQAGLRSSFIDSETKRQRGDEIAKDFPQFKRRLIRRLAGLDDASWELLALSPKRNCDLDKLDRHLGFFELGGDLRSIRLSSARISKLVSSLKNYAAPERTHWEDVDLREGLEDTLIVLNNRLRSYRLHTNFSEVSLIRGIPSELNQVWTNLLINASQATPTNGDIWISIEATSDGVKVSISDSGSGIKPEFIAQIFEMNFTTKKTKSNFGLGLGLSLSKDIVEKHGGQIVASNRKDGGACFEVLLPTDISSE